MSAWQQAVIDFAECGTQEAAWCAEAESVVRQRTEESVWGSELFYELVYRQVMVWWAERP